MEAEDLAIMEEDDGQSDLAPLSPVRRILAEIFCELQEGWLTPDTTPDLLLKSMMMVLIQAGIILMLNLIYGTEEFPVAVAVFQSLHPMMRVLIIAMLMIELIKLNVQWLA
jgi:hypothetical protein